METYQVDWLCGVGLLVWSKLSLLVFFLSKFFLKPMIKVPFIFAC